jgi:hypothetical protein
MRRLILVVACILLASPVFAQPKPDPIRVYVFTAHPEGGIVDQASKDRDGHVKNIIDRLKRDKTIAVVADRAGADVAVEVTKTLNWHVEAWLSFGDYTTEFHSREWFTMRGAAEDLADAMKRWIKDNRDRVIGARAK